MATYRITLLSATLFVLAATASAARHTGMGLGRELKQTTPLPTVPALPTLPAGGALPPVATIPAIPAAGAGTDPFASALSRMVTFLQNDAQNLQSAIGGAAAGVNATVSSIPLVQTFETQLASALKQLQTAISAITSQGVSLGSTAQTNLDSFLSNLFSSVNSRDPVTAIVQTAMDALPPVAGRR